MALMWQANLSSLPLCIPPETCQDDYMVNSVAISDDGTRAVGGTYYYNYEKTTRDRTDGRFGTYCYDTAGTGTRLWANEYNGDQGIYAVAISGDGSIAAGGGLLREERENPFRAARGVLRAFEVATGKRLLNFTGLSNRITSVSLSGNGRVLAAVAKRRLYVFTRNSSGSFSGPQTIQLRGYSPSVAVHPTGRWLAACDQKGTVYAATISGGVVNPPARWIIREPRNPGNPQSQKFEVKFNCVAVSRAADVIAVGGGDFVYVLTLASIQGNPPRHDGRFTSFDAAGSHNVRWVAISDNGSFVTAVINDEDAAGRDIGQLLKLSHGGGNLNEAWRRQLDHNPNSTSMNSAGTLITASDGYPNDVPGTFYLFDANGNELWRHGTTMMCWPMVISARGAGISGGSDANEFFFFVP